ncbi:uncharacterized protein APUU_21671A [Aspergillus puulaauensis]|uniref:Uncharacterized protein n=1 Tax=Aspergillus puulaauensis TaxID=1220207 RepID=A0A7R7XII0_9EURO|nr:uncharacterized protein APUU_21671A [Aspergillus puulaauensis]BCS21239.1 hypothetical protein APUU_21671A [Aspergillus puulaauensis]
MNDTSVEETKAASPPSPPHQLFGLSISEQQEGGGKTSNGRIGSSAAFTRLSRLACVHPRSPSCLHLDVIITPSLGFTHESLTNIKPHKARIATRAASPYFSGLNRLYVGHSPFRHIIIRWYGMA